MPINIDNFSEQELSELNFRIVERLKFLRSMHTHSEMMQFSPGEKVSFDPPGQETQFATLVKFNRKTVTVITEAGEKWNVSPHLLNKVKSVQSSSMKNIESHQK